MSPQQFWNAFMQGTKILKPPKHSLATFGTTTYHYILLSEMPRKKDHSRWREGRVTAERPRIITPDLWRKRFEGFGEQAEQVKALLDSVYGEAFRALEYRFKNELEKTAVEPLPLAELKDRAFRSVEKRDSPRLALLQGPDNLWSLSVMKFIVEMSLHSFPTNLQELDEHGYFNPEQKRESAQRAQAEQLFREAGRNPSAIQKLATHLKETGLFDDYQDRFFAMVRKN